MSFQEDTEFEVGDGVRVLALEGHLAGKGKVARIATIPWTKSVVYIVVGKFHYIHSGEQGRREQILYGSELSPLSPLEQLAEQSE